MLLLTPEFLSDNVHYVVQPQCTPDGTITGAELLVRLKNSCYLTPAEFFRLVAMYGTSHVFDCFTIDAAIRILPTFLKLNSRFNLSINICPPSVNIEPYLSDYITEKLVEAGIDGRSLTVELTEHMRRTQTDRLVSFIDGVHAARGRVVLDDILMRDSRWHHLQLPVDGIKLDRSYITMLDESPEGEILVSGVVDTAQRLGKSVTAEGVEHPRQLRKVVQKLGISSIQGFLFYRPMSFESLIELLLWQERQRAILPVAA